MHFLLDRSPFKQFQLPCNNDLRAARRDYVNGKLKKEDVYDVTTQLHARNKAYHLVRAHFAEKKLLASVIVYGSLNKDVDVSVVLRTLYETYVIPSTAYNNNGTLVYRPPASIMEKVGTTGGSEYDALQDIDFCRDMILEGYARVVHTSNYNDAESVCKRYAGLGYVAVVHKSETYYNVVISFA